MPKQKKQYPFHICLCGKSKIRDMLDELIAQERKSVNPSAGYTSVTRQAITEYYIRHGGK